MGKPQVVANFVSNQHPQVFDVQLAASAGIHETALAGHSTAAASIVRGRPWDVTVHTVGSATTRNRDRHELHHEYVDVVVGIWARPLLPQVACLVARVNDLESTDVCPV